MAASAWLCRCFVPAVLAAGVPEQTAFMSDEAMESVPGLKPIQYTAKHYALYLRKMVERTEQLNRGEAKRDVAASCTSYLKKTPRKRVLVCSSCCLHITHI